MHEFQYKITCLVRPPGNHSFEVCVYARQAPDGADPGPWKFIVSRRVWIDDLVGTHGRMLKTLLRGLA